MLGSAPKNHNSPYPGSTIRNIESPGAHDSLNKSTTKQSTGGTIKIRGELQGWRESTSPYGMSVRLANILAAGGARLATLP